MRGSHTLSKSCVKSRFYKRGEMHPNLLKSTWIIINLKLSTHVGNHTHFLGICISVTNP